MGRTESASFLSQSFTLVANFVDLELRYQCKTIFYRQLILPPLKWYITYGVVGYLSSFLRAVKKISQIAKCSFSEICSVPLPCACLPSEATLSEHMLAYCPTQMAFNSLLLWLVGGMHRFPGSEVQ